MLKTLDREIALVQTTKANTTRRQAPVNYEKRKWQLNLIG